MIDTLEFNGRTVRVEANWNAIVAFLEATGQDSWEGLTGIGKLKPSEVAPLMAACINEGERLEGRESNLTAQDIGANKDYDAISRFIDIYIKQSSPKTAPDQKKE